MLANIKDHICLVKDDRFFDVVTGEEVFTAKTVKPEPVSEVEAPKKKSRKKRY